MTHINEITFEGDTPWVKAMNLAHKYYEKGCDENLSEKERQDARESWYQIRYEIESGCYGNNT